MPLTWLVGAAALTRCAFPETAVYACTVLREVLVTYDRAWTAEHLGLLDAVRHALLRAARDGRAHVVAASRRALLDCRVGTSPFVREHVSEHAEVLRALLDLDSDGRLAVEVAGQDWVREPDRPAR